MVHQYVYEDYQCYRHSSLGYQSPACSEGVTDGRRDRLVTTWAGKKVIGALPHPVRDVTWYAVRIAFVTD